MELALVVAIVRGDKLGAVEKKLHIAGVRGITVIKARGFGEHSLPHDILGHPLMHDQAKLEIYVARDQVDHVAAAIIDAAHTGTSGDGIVAILPVHRVFSVRTRSDTIPNRATEALAGASGRWARPTENGGPRG
ncbi:MAG TPA: P-II family nitrogen regulator [Casimicrobiaceae bacterium]